MEESKQEKNTETAGFIKLKSAGEIEFWSQVMSAQFMIVRVVIAKLGKPNLPPVIKERLIMSMGQCADLAVLERRKRIGAF